MSLRRRQAVDEPKGTPAPQEAHRGRLRTLRRLILLVVTVLTLGITILHGVRIVDLVEEQALAQARSYTDLIVAARSWNARHGGAFIRKAPGVETNPYLIELGVVADLELSDGSLLTLRNPAAMTREIGDELNNAGTSSEFKLTSLDPVNPDNAPDAWEAEQLRALDMRSAPAEAWAVVEADAQNEQYFRYMRTLLVDESCLECHEEAGYRVGDVRGALSVSLPYTETADSLGATTLQLLLTALIALAAVWTSVIVLTRIQVRQIVESQRALEIAATVDPMTGLFNRGHTLDRLETEIARARRESRGVGVIMADIDDFKHVNDAHGHAAGDRVLGRVASAMARTVRRYDLVGRIGGEEMLVIAPGIEPSALTDLAERVRTSLAEEFGSDEPYGVTLSAGTAFASPDGDETVDALVARADEAMYRAKRTGKNRVVSG
ncbi:MAG: GGDEF domain-containing protein [Coriobacteriia bacterium]